MSGPHVAETTPMTLDDDVTQFGASAELILQVPYE